MVSNNNSKSLGVKKAHDKIEQLFSSDMDASEMNLRDLSRTISKMPDRNQDKTV